MIKKSFLVTIEVPADAPSEGLAKGMQRAVNTWRENLLVNEPGVPRSCEVVSFDLKLDPQAPLTYHPPVPPTPEELSLTPPRDDWAAKGDEVNHPSHYNQGKIEVIEFIEDQRLDYHSGNVIKYICRAGKKSQDPRQDLNKAIWYAKRRLAIIDAEINKRTPIRPNEMNHVSTN